MGAGATVQVQDDLKEKTPAEIAAFITDLDQASKDKIFTAVVPAEPVKLAAKEIDAALTSSTPEEIKAFLESLDAETKGRVREALKKFHESLISAATLAKQNSETSQAILEAFKNDDMFKKVSKRLCDEILARDAADGEKLAKGIALAVEKGVLPKEVEVEKTLKVSVSGKAADAIADEIIAALGDAPSKGCVMVLQGLSGTGKGTTVAKLKEKLPNAQTWSNGNIFRSLTLLAVTHSEKEACPLEDALKPEKLAEFSSMLEFDKFDGKDFFDVKIEGLGMKHFVSEVEKTVLKDSNVAKNIPTVAEVTQGEVIKFVSNALAKMSAAGINVLVEGREQTLNHIRTPHRFELVLDDPSIIGQRQAALQVGGIAWEKINKDATTSIEDAHNAVVLSIETLAS